VTSRDLAELRDGVERQERALRAAFVELGEATRESMEPDRWIRGNPLAGWFLAFAIGCWWGGRAPRHIR
jgi:hypothetical protein